MNLETGTLQDKAQQSAAADDGGVGGGGGATHACIATLPPLITTNWMYIFQQADLSVMFRVVCRLLAAAVIT
jgi:hypothetical protein